MSENAPKLEDTLLQSLDYLTSKHADLMWPLYQLLHKKIGFDPQHLNDLLEAGTKVSGGLGSFTFDPAKGNVKEDIKNKYGYEGDLVNLFADNKEFLIHKWHHYLPLYERYFARYRGTKVRFLEIGVSEGGSLQMWRRYFGDQAIIYGIDINPDCARLNGQSAQVRIGSQADPEFLKSVVAEMGGVDVVLDDGSHHMEHIPVSLQTLFPLLSLPGTYMIEDLHTAYWDNFGGGYRASGNFFRGPMMHIIDDMHQWYHFRGQRHPEMSTNCAAIHVHDSIVVLEKDRVFEPVHSKNV
ncbi:MAG: hypothetical protein ACXU8N_15235 [Telluria sp.]